MPDASRGSSPVGDTETFDPSHPSVSPGDSILLPISKVPGYLDAALKVLTPYAEARTSFITCVSSLMSENLTEFETTALGTPSDTGCQIC